MHHRLVRTCVLLFVFVLGCISCETDDVDPVVVLSIDSTNNGRISEKSAKAFFTATLNGVSPKEVVVRISPGGSAIRDQDYRISSLELRIPAGKTVGRLEITTVEDGRVEGDETLLITVVSNDHSNLLSKLPFTLTISDGDSDSDSDGVSDANDGCPLDSGSLANNGCPPGYGLVINEVLYDPSDVGLAGDANGDGRTDKYEDGFIELVNTLRFSQDMSGFTVSDLNIATNTANVRYTFPSGTVLPAGKALVLFGGGTPSGSFGGSQVLLVGNPAGLSMNNSGEKIQLADPLGNVVLTFDSDALSNNPNESYTLNPDLTGVSVQHGSIPPGRLFSPGTKNDGSSF